MSEKQAAFLRGVNVGKGNRIAMADLRALVEGLGYRDVRTLLNSGNVVFSVPAKSKGDPASRIEKALASELGVTSKVTVLTAGEIDAVVQENPLLSVATNPSRLLISIFKPADRALLEPLAKQKWTPEALAVGTRVAYVWCPDGVLASQVSAAIGRALRDGVTARNWATFLKIKAMTDGTA